MKTVDIIKLAKGYYVKYSYGSTHQITYCKTKKEAEALQKSLL